MDLIAMANQKIRTQAQNLELLKEQYVIKDKRVEELLTALIETTDELESWQRDQGDYGTKGYDTWIPSLRKLIKGEK